MRRLRARVGPGYPDRPGYRPPLGSPAPIWRWLRRSAGRRRSLRQHDRAFILATLAEAVAKQGNYPQAKKALDLALSTIEKQFGKGAIMKLDGENKIKTPVILVFTLC